MSDNEKFVEVGTGKYLYLKGHNPKEVTTSVLSDYVWLFRILDEQNKQLKSINNKLLITMLASLVSGIILVLVYFATS
jgi:hypothetical protein